MGQFKNLKIDPSYSFGLGKHLEDCSRIVKSQRGDNLAPGLSITFDTRGQCFGCDPPVEKRCIIVYETLMGDERRTAAKACGCDSTAADGNWISY